MMAYYFMVIIMFPNHAFFSLIENRRDRYITKYSCFLPSFRVLYTYEDSRKGSSSIFYTRDAHSAYHMQQSFKSMHESAILPS